MGQVHVDDEIFQVVIRLADGVILEADPNELRPYMNTNHYGITPEQLSKLKPSNYAGFRTQFEKVLGSLPADKRSLILNVFGTMRYRAVLSAVFNAPLGKSLNTISRLEINKMIWSWYNSPLEFKRTLYKVVTLMSIVGFVGSNSVAYRAMNHPERFSNMTLPDVHKVYLDALDAFKFKLLDPAENSLYFDVIIVGSGSGGGVAASELADKGHKVLVLEKGHYYEPSELDFNESEAHEKLYENGAGLVTTEDGSTMILAGATLGGGTTINWSACLRLNPVVRKSWSETVPWISGPKLDEAYDYVYDKMGCTKDFISPGLTDRKLKEGAALLGLNCRDIPQNVKQQPHACGLCGAGCRYGIKQGGIQCWLKNAAQKGAQIIDDSSVLNVTRDSSGKATGVKFTKNGQQYHAKARAVIISCGSLQTPGVLKRSGFRNQHIGSHLKLHPVTCISGIYPEEEADNWNAGILTTVTDNFNNLDGKGHGPLLESMLCQPLYQLLFVPFKVGEASVLQTMAYKNKCATILDITRDKGEGKVTYTKQDPLQPRVDYTVSKYDRKALGRGLVESSKVLYITGATIILTPCSNLPVFKSNKPKEQRTLKDADFDAWLALVEKEELVPLRTPFGSAHQMGSCRMGASPKDSAVNLNGALWECNNCFVVDTSIYPSASGCNPMLTCMALAKVLSSNIDKYLSSYTPRL